MKPPFSAGDFVNCLFPFGERPDRPGPSPHVVYCEHFLTNRAGTLSVVALYTTTALRKPNEPKNPWILEISEGNSRGMGMQKAFGIDTRRIAFMAPTVEFFPDINRPDHGIRGRATEHLKKVLTRKFIEASRIPDLIRAAGPPLDWPKKTTEREP